MTLELHFHPLASFCHKVLIALYENETPFEPHIVDLGDEKASAAFRRLWPIAKMPVLRDRARGQTVPESTIIIEYLAQHYPGRARLLPQEADLAWQARLWDRFYDLYVQEPMQKIVTDRLRPPGRNDPHGVELAKGLLRTSYDMIEREMEAKPWAMGEAFGMVDCAAAPALFYAAKVVPFGDDRPKLAAYLERLMARPSYARALDEARPYFKLFPQ
jgi:glutathione S-transferase